MPRPLQVVNSYLMAPLETLQIYGFFMDFKELDRYLKSLPDRILPEAAEIVAETATEYYRETFRKKAFDGNPWEPARTQKKTGSLLIDSGAMLNSIRASTVTPEKVVVSAGNDKVTYARIHNEGYSGPVTVPAHTRRTRHGTVNVRQHSRNVSIPRRQFLGDSAELNDRIHERIEKYIESLEI